MKYSNYLLHAFLLQSSSVVNAFTTPKTTIVTTSGGKNPTSFLSNKQQQQQQQRFPSYVESDVSAFLFRDLLKKARGSGGGGGGDNDNNDDDDSKKMEEIPVTSQKENEVVETVEKEEAVVEKKKEEDTKEGFLPFFAQVMMGTAKNITDEVQKQEQQQQKEEVVEVVESPAPAPPSPPPPVPTLSPQEKAIAEAKALRAQAEKARLEAEKMDAILTLEKVSKLESKLEAAQKGGDKKDEVTSIREQINVLQMKLRGETMETTTPSSTTTAAVKKDEEMNLITTSSTTSDSTTTTTQEEKKAENPTIPSLSYTEIQDRVDRFKNSPKFMRQLVAKTADFDFTDIDSINTTALIIQLYEDEQKAVRLMETSSTTDFTNVQVEEGSGKPKFTPEQIEQKAKDVSRLPQFVKNLYGDDANNDTAIALSLLEDDYKEEQQRKNRGGWFGSSPSSDGGDKKKDGDDKNPISAGNGGLFAELKRRREEMSELDAMVESLYPKTTRKEDEGPSEAQVNKLVSDVLTKSTVPFMPSGKPEAVPGGFLIRGTVTKTSSSSSSKDDDEDGNSKFEGDNLIEAIDQTIERNAPALKDSMSVFYVADPYPQEEELGPGVWPPVLFVTGPDVWRGPQQIAGTIVSSLGLATLWYTAIESFLLNPTFMARADEQLALADSGLTPDLGWLNESAGPLFLYLLCIQLAHDTAHRLVANAYKMEITIPTFVPSLVTGIASSVTTLKAPPKNKQALFDFAFAGPFTGMILSLIALYFGLVLTVSTDAASYANLPALPVQFLRESALGGGIIDGVLGQGVLDALPPVTGATSASGAGAGLASANNLPLHPLAIAGYISLNLSALSLLPFGRTDGGRMSLALFGRNGSPPVGLITSLLLFLRGAFGSDLILFYTTYILFFQNEPEIPLRNEVDEVDFSRILLATVSGVLVLLTLLPMD